MNSTPQNGTDSTNSTISASESQENLQPIVAVSVEGAAGTTVSSPIITDQHGERYWQIFENNVEWLRFSEAKAGLILTMYGILFTIFYSNAEQVFSSVQGSKIILLTTIFFGLSSMCSILFAFLVVRPRMKAPGKNVIYFRHIAKFADPQAYRNEAHKKLDDADEYATHITDQIYYVSKITNTKFIYSAWSIWAFAASIMILVISVLIYACSILEV